MKEYYINPAGTEDRIGPISEEALRQALKTGAYPLNSLVWCEGMGNWQPADSTILRVGGPPLPHATKSAGRRTATRHNSRVRGPQSMYSPYGGATQPHPGARVGGVLAVRPPSYMGSSITALIFSIILAFCVPGIVLSIIAISRGGTVNVHWRRGNTVQAARESGAACTLSTWAWFVLVIWLALFLISIFLG